MPSPRTVLPGPRQIMHVSGGQRGQEMGVNKALQDCAGGGSGIGDLEGLVSEVERSRSMVCIMGRVSQRLKPEVWGTYPSS